jgi:uncharacterized protein YjbI with pentapeptide repeats
MEAETGSSPAESEQRSRRLPSWLVVFAAFLAAVVGVIVVRLILFGFAGNTIWDYRFAGKTVWKYLDVFLVPVAVALVTVWLTLWENRRQRKYETVQERLQQQAADIRKARELEVENQRTQDSALQTYIDQMSQLLADKEQPLHRASPGDNLSAIARGQTLTLLARLNNDRKSKVIQFLYESHLISTDRLVIHLAGADLRGIDLRHFDLRSAHLRGVDLRHADMSDTNLSGANLDGAYLYSTNLSGANLSGASLRGTDLTSANLYGADLSDANLRFFISTDQGAGKLTISPVVGAQIVSVEKPSRVELAIVRTVLQDADLRYCWLNRADLRGSLLQGADLYAATLVGANFSSAAARSSDGYYSLGQATMLEDARNIEQEQLDMAVGDQETTLPKSLQRPKSWDRREPEEWILNILS